MITPSLKFSISPRVLNCTYFAVYFLIIFRQYEDNKKLMQPRQMDMQEVQFNIRSSPERKANYPTSGGPNNQKQNYQQNQNYNQQGQGNPRMNPHGHNQQNQRFQHQNQYQNQNQQQQYQGGGNNYEQNQFYPQMDQQMGGSFYNPNFGGPQMQAPPYYGM